MPYDTPFGPVSNDLAFLERLQQRAPFDIFEDELSHRREHALEFQAVYLRHLEHTGAGCPARVVSILCVPPETVPDGGTPRDDPATEQFIQALAETIAEDGQRACVIAGADFAHVGPQFGDPADDEVLRTLAPLFPDRDVRGCPSLNLIWGLGSFHCLSQQEPLA